MAKKVRINKEVHPNWYFDVPVMNTLILGSYPPHPKRYDYQFYYPHTRNNFWKILAEVADTELQYFENKNAVDERKNIMKVLRVGVENMGKVIEREGESANDGKIEIKEYNDILGIIKSHKELHTILLPGFHYESSTAKSFVRYLEQNGVKHTKPEVFAFERTFIVYYDKREIRCVILYSTSPAFRRKHTQFVPHFKKYL